MIGGNSHRSFFVKVDMKRLKQVRFLRGFTQWDLALLTGISPSKISLIERGYITANDDDQKKLADALGVKPEVLNNHGVGLDSD
ncbi:helix-turn-helix domain-containing protein [candidate division KSB1 bacterium]